MPRLLRIAGALLLVAAASVAATAPAAHAQPAPLQLTPVVCTGDQTAHYAPPLGPTLRDTTVQVTERLGDRGNGTCVVGPFVNGIGTAVFHQQASCLLPAPGGTLPAPNVLTYVWHTGDSSTITFAATAVKRALGQSIITSIGTVTAGFNQGAPAMRVKVLADLDLMECLAGNVTQRGGPMTLTIG